MSLRVKSLNCRWKLTDPTHPNYWTHSTLEFWNIVLAGSRLKIGYYTDPLDAIWRETPVFSEKTPLQSYWLDYKHALRC